MSRLSSRSRCQRRLYKQRNQVAFGRQAKLQASLSKQGRWLPAAPSRIGPIDLDCQGGGVLLVTPRLYRTLSPSCLIEEGGEGKGENRISQGLETLNLKGQMRIRCVREGLAGSTVPPSGRRPRSDTGKPGGRISSFLDVRCAHQYTRQHPLSREALAPSP